jgi:5-methylcytosine-specific restriction endonuclease McrA
MRGYLPKKIRKYCSIECTRLGRRNRLNLICVWCNNPFWIRASRPKYANIRCCSKRCSNALKQSTKKTRSEILKKYNNKLEVKLKKREYHFGGFYKYKLREKALKRDSFTCQICKSKRGLVVHHTDGNRFNNKLSNLITLCKRCHPKIHGSRELKDWRIFI